LVIEVVLGLLLGLAIIAQPGKAAFTGSVQLVATVTLTISLVVAATAVSLGNRSLAGRPLPAAPIAAPLDHAPSQ
jgi:hypothetical protein